jgi:chromate transport protein ChrA
VVLLVVVLVVWVPFRLSMTGRGCYAVGSSTAAAYMTGIAIRRSRLAAAFLDGVNVASLALMAVVTLQLARAAFVDWPTLAIGLLGAFLLLRYKVNSTWLIIASAIAGVLVHVAGTIPRP